MRKTFDKDTKLFDDITKRTVHCNKCGHSVTFGYFRDKIVCSHCGYYVYKNKRIEFKDKLKRIGIKK